MTAQLCPDCLKENRIATLRGPTCPHQEANGAKWFPAWWSEATAEYRRLEWLKKLNPSSNETLYRNR